MKKLSKIMAAEQAVTLTPYIESGEVTSWQGLILFDDVLDGEKVLDSQEIEKLLVYVYGQKRVSQVNTDYTEGLQDWLRDEMYKADVNQKAMVYLVKARFDDWATPTHSDQFEAPLEIQLFKPNAEVENDFLVITCKWSDGLFRNDRHIIGVIAETDDLLTIIFEHIKKD